MIGHNTDIVGFDKAIKALNFKMKNKKILILGAGGVVPSIVFALKQMDVFEITISNRTKQKAENLKVLFKNLNVVEWGNFYDFDVVINATSIGLNNEKINLDFSRVGKNKLFYDVIYNPSNNFFKKEKNWEIKLKMGDNVCLSGLKPLIVAWQRTKVNFETLKILKND